MNRLAPFMDKLDRHGRYGCWEFTGYITPDGYGRTTVADHCPARPLAHRYSYEINVGPIADGMEIDHLCRNRACCNPTHLEPVTHRVNVDRGDAGLPQRSKTACKYGHAFTDENTYLDSQGKRHCRACNNEASRRKRRKAR